MCPPSATSSWSPARLFPPSGSCRVWGLQLHLAPASVVVTNGGICAPPPPALPGRPGSSPSRSDFLTLHFYFLCFMNKIKRVNSLSGIGCTSGTPPHPPPRTTLPPRRRLLQLVSLWHTPLCMYRCVCVCVCVWGWLCVTPPPPCPSNAEHLSVLELLQDKWFCFDEIRSRALPLSPSLPKQAAAVGW